MSSGALSGTRYRTWLVVAWPQSTSCGCGLGGRGLPRGTETAGHDARHPPHHRRSDRRGDLFPRQPDRFVWTRRFIRTLDRFGWTCIGFAQLTTHVRAIVETPDESISVGMHYLNMF